MKDMDMEIILKCNVCGNDQFSATNERVDDIRNAPEETEIKCSDCGQVLTKQQLIEENSGIIDANYNDFKKDIIKNVRKDFKKIFK